MTLKEVKELEKEIVRTKEENEILKKAMDIFATKKLDEVIEFIDKTAIKPTMILRLCVPF